MNDDNSTEQSNQVIQFDGREQATDIALQLAQQAHREICFFGNTIDPILFDNTAFVDCISEFSRRSDKTVVKFVVHSTSQNNQHGHRLIPLMQRLTSSIHLHISAKQHQDLSQLFMVVDDSSYLYCPHHIRYQGRACFHDPLEARDLKKTFNDIWDHSTPDVAMRRLTI